MFAKRIRFSSKTLNLLGTNMFTRLIGSKAERTTVYFSISDRVGALENILKTLGNLSISLTSIESRPSKTKGDYDFFVDFTAEPDLVKTALKEIEKKSKEVRIVSSGDDDAGVGQVPWFPRKISDLDSFAEKVLSYGAELDADHPGFKDPAYRERRQMITNQALTYRHGNPLPHVDYTENEIKTWGIVYRKLRSMYKTHACFEQQNCGYSENNIPQIEDISKFLKGRPFLFRLHWLDYSPSYGIAIQPAPFYTPEPDVCHELLGHVPLYADPDFASFSQEIGLASLGASDEDLKKLATIYWFTVEFGLCKQGSEIKAYGAGLLSSFGELEYCLSDKPKLLPFNCEVMGVQEYPITSFQPVYFVADSFKQMKDEVKEFATSLNRPFAVNYNALTQSIEVLDTKDKVLRYAAAIKGDMTRLISAIDKIVKS
ncbi:hypothetical protein HK103_004195 [Boothiomyces macroporosus]|uniref:phenylalanine 4-monooxygenase n=1 Tax=Boothiomyces macroporosus TaxID=261099 RepID=A0AAD5UH17_9FUNG|nr:hypothetical protein HK103_004195 [Boothiomyces macroporosus]